MNAADSSCRTWMNDMRSWRVRNASMMPLMPSPGRPKTTSTPQSISVSMRTSEAFMIHPGIGMSSCRTGTHTATQLCSEDCPEKAAIYKTINRPAREEGESGTDCRAVWEVLYQISEGG